MVDSAVATVACGVVFQGFVEFFVGEFWPGCGCDVEFGVGDLPEEIVADPHFASGADEEVGVWHAAGVEVVGDGLFGDLAGGELVGLDFVGDLSDGVGDFEARAVVDSEAEGHAGVLFGGIEGVCEFVEDGGW